MAEKRDVAGAKVIPLTDEQIMHDKARRIMARERKKNPRVVLYPIEELIDTAFFLLDQRQKERKSN
ncbi:MAG: hypothetical protein AAB575_04615 [Patescibacteria group bacterium]